MRSNAPMERDSYNILGRVRRDGFRYYDDQYLKIIRGLSGTVLDIGCGFGSDFLLWLRERGHFSGQIISIDVDPRVFSEEYSGMNSDLRYKRPGDSTLIASAEDIPLEDASISLVNQSAMFADIGSAVNYRGVFSEVHRVLRPSGLYVINDSNSPRRSDGFVEILRRPGGFMGVYRKRWVLSYNCILV